VSEQQIAPNRPTAHKFKPTNTEATSPFGFFLLCVYTALVFIRPHEWPIFETELPILRTFLIITFIFYVTTLSPKKWNWQATIMVVMFFFMLLSEMRARRFFSDLTFVTEWVTSDILPFILFLGFLVSLRRQRIILFISLMACVIMVHQAWFQIGDPLGMGWAENAIFRGSGDDAMMQVRYVGIFHDPNDMGMFLVMNIPIAMYFLVNTKSFMIRMLSLGIMAALFVGIYWTGSRGSLVGSLAVIAAYIFVRFGRVKFMILTALSLPIVGVALASFRTIGLEDKSVQDRLTAWYEGIQMVKYRPLFGFGKDRFLEYHSKVAHNSFVTVMSELGAIGYTLWMTFILLIFVMAYRIAKLPAIEGPKGDALRQEQSLNIYLSIAMIGYCSTAFFISRSYILYFYVFAAFVAASYMRVQKSYPQFDLKITAATVARVAVCSAGSLIVLYLIIRFLLTIR